VAQRDTPGPDPMPAERETANPYPDKNCTPEAPPFTGDDGTDPEIEDG
jgi:hypothetical protein